jgi:cytochrome-b5 reductase
LAENYKERFTLTYTVDVKPEDKPWNGNVGFVTKEMIQSNLPAPSPDTIILFCGPPPFEDMMKKHVKELGYVDDQVFKF